MATDLNWGYSNMAAAIWLQYYCYRSVMNQLTKLMLQQENLRKQSNYSSLLQQYNTRNMLECYTQATVVVDHVFTPKGHLCHLIPKSQHTSTTKAHYWYLIISTIGMKVHYWYLDHLYNWYSSIAFLTLPKTTRTPSFTPHTKIPPLSYPNPNVISATCHKCIVDFEAAWHGFWCMGNMSPKT
jgi:hypothetical protein